MVKGNKLHGEVEKNQLLRYTREGKGCYIVKNEDYKKIFYLQTIAMESNYNNCITYLQSTAPHASLMDKRVLGANNLIIWQSINFYLRS